MRRILITAADALSTSVSGRGLRALGMASALSKHHEVTVASGGDLGPLLPPNVSPAVGPEARSEALATAEVVVTAGELSMGELLRLKSFLVADLYDPRLFQLLVAEVSDDWRQREMDRELRKQRQLWRAADVVLAATNEQRDFYLGATLGSRFHAVGPTLPTWDKRIVTVPNGIELDQPRAEPALRRELGLRDTDVVLIWGGGVWDWLDPELLLESLSRARHRAPDLKLLLLGVRREGRPLPLSRRHSALFGEGADLGSAVVVHSDWIPPDRRGAYLLASDGGVLAQYDNLEAHFSFRQRIGDCLWAGLPILATAGDPLTGQVAARGWGLVSPPQDGAAFAENLVRFAMQPDLRTTIRSQIQADRQEWSWQSVCQPLLEAIDALPAARPPLRLRGIGSIPSIVTNRVRQKVPFALRRGGAADRQ